MRSYTRPSFVARLVNLALFETLISLLLSFSGAYLISGYLDFQQSPFAKMVTPVIYSFGVWPFVAMVVAGLYFGFRAVGKARS